MVIFFLLLVLFDGLIGVLAFLAVRRLTQHMRENPEASKLVAEHVIAPLLRGLLAEKVEEPEDKPIDAPTAKPETKRAKGTLI